MLPEARDRQKFVSDVQYLRDMQHKVESEYQACLRRQEYRRDPNEKKRDQPWGQDTNFERPRFSSTLTSKQSSSEEDLLAEPKLSAKNSAAKCDSRLPAIDQTSVKQKHKSTMTKRKPEKGSPSKPSPENSPLLPGHAHSFSELHQLALSRNRHHHQLPSSTAQAPQILSRKRRPNLGRLTVSPDLESPRASSPDVQSPRASGDRSRQKSQLPVRAPAPRGADPVVQQEGPTWARDTKLKRPTRERRNLVPSSQLMTMTKNTPERAQKVDLSGFSQNEPRSALSQAFQRTNSPQVMSKSVGSPLATTMTVEGSKRVPFRFRDEDFYSILSLNPEGENDDTEEETHIEEELLLAGMHPPRSPSNHRRSRFLGTSAAQAKNKSFEDNPEKCRADSLRSECSHGSLISNAMEPVTKQPSVGQKMFQDHRLPDGGSAKENDSSDSENEEKTFCSWDTKTEPTLDDDLDAENVFSDCTSMDDKPGPHDYERDWQTYLNNSSTSLDYFLSGRPTAPRAPMNSSYNTPESLVHSDPRDDIPVDLSTASTVVHCSDLDGNPRFHVRRPLSPIRNRNPFASAEHHSHLPGNGAQEFDVRRAEAITLTSQSQGDPFHTEDILLNPQSNMSVVEAPSPSPSRTNFQGHLHVPGSLQENIPFTFFAVSEFPYHNGSGNRIAISGFTDEKETTKIKTDPEKLKKLQESLLEEDSEEEGDMCRICQIAGGSPTNPLLEPCGCVGSLQFVHQECLKKWLKVKITSGADLGAVKTCEMCKQGLLVDLDDFNMTEFYRKHQQSRAQNELMNSGLYLVLLLHLYEQRFAELMRINYNRAVRERLSRNFPQPRPEENENSELGDGNESSIYQNNSRVI